MFPAYALASATVVLACIATTGASDTASNRVYPKLLPAVAVVFAILQACLRISN